MKNQYTKFLKDISRYDILVVDRVVRYLNKQKITGEKVIDLGCGDGKVSRLLARMNGKVTGVDASKNLINKAQSAEKEKSLGVKYLLGNIVNLPSGIRKQKFDIALSLLTVLHLSKLEFKKFVKGVNKVTKKDGLFIIGNIHPSRVAEKEDSRWIKTLYNPESKNYFLEEKLRAILYDRSGDKFRLSYYHHSLEYIFNTLSENGFTVKHIIEPKPTTAEMKKYRGYFSYENKRPSYIIFVCIKS